MPISQETRWAAISTPLGKDVLLFRRMAGVEELGRLFQYELELASENHAIKYDDIIGKNVTVRINIDENKVRYFNGFITRFARSQEVERLTYYRATMVPWLWFLTRTSDCRIFQNMDAVAIIKQIFKEHGFSDIEDQLGGVQYLKREYCVQYRETDFQFVSRLMEQEGVYYYFKHEDGKHSLVLANSMTGHGPWPGFAEMEFEPFSSGEMDRDHITEWSAYAQFLPGAYNLRDYDFTAPKKKMDAPAKAVPEHLVTKFEMYDYPGLYKEVKDGNAYSKVRIEEMHAEYEVGTGKGRIPAMSTGYTFTMTGHPNSAQNREYLFTSTTITVLGGDFAGRTGGDEEEPFTCEFTAIPTANVFRSASLTPKTFVRGPQTATVVGPQGEEIHTDEYGRVKVQFHWDRYGKADENSSCWIRVAQSWAGKTWGAMFIPRIGMEVVVEFLEGDPDRPIITGCVYNGVMETPYKLPDFMTQSTIKSNSSKEAKGFNEIRFEDKKDSEQIFIHAQKNYDLRILNDRFEEVGNNRHLKVKMDRIEKVENDYNLQVVRDLTEKVTRDHNVTIEGKEAIVVKGSHSFNVEGDVIEEFKKTQTQIVTGDYYLKAKNIVIEAETNVTVKVGKSFIAIESGGISLGTSGTIDFTADGKIDVISKANITVDATGNLKQSAKGNAEVVGTGGLKLESTAKADLKSPMTSVTGDGMLTVKGGLVKIN